MFTQLQVHSHYSLLDAIGTPKALIARAQELDMTTLALTDYHGMYGAIDFYTAAKKADIKPILGIEIGLVQDRTRATTGKKAGTIMLLAKDAAGYQTLLELTSHGNMEGYHEQPHIDREILQRYGKGLICCMSGRQSYIGHMLLQQEPENKIIDTLQLVMSYLEPGDMYLGVVAQDAQQTPKEQQLTEALLPLATQLDIPVFTTSNVHYVHSEDKEAFDVAMAIKDGKRIYDTDRRTRKGDYSLQSGDDVRSILTKNGHSNATIDSFFSVTQDITKKIDIELPLGKILFPNYDTSTPMQERYEKVKDTLITD